MSDWIEKHSVNCYFCNELVDERKCHPADRYNNGDGGDICPKCLKEKHEGDLSEFDLFKCVSCESIADIEESCQVEAGLVCSYCMHSHVWD